MSIRNEDRHEWKLQESDFMKERRCRIQNKELRSVVAEPKDIKNRKVSSNPVQAISCVYCVRANGNKNDVGHVENPSE